ncbi:MAG: T9SS type A sorting domain-containing protein, partial [Candidatus Neomarinimicrobiota bacterium]
STEPWYVDELTNLFYSLANFTDQFDSDDVDGDSDTYGNGKYRRASNRLDASKTFNIAYKVNALGVQVRELIQDIDYMIVDCEWSNDMSIVYSASYLSEYFSNPFYTVRAYYTDGSHDTFFLFDWDDVPWAVCGEIYQPQLQARAIGHTAALYQIFWSIVNPIAEDNYEENDDMAHAYDLGSNWSTWLHNVGGFGIHGDHDWYKIYVPSNTECLYIECDFVHVEGDIDIDLYNSSGSLVASSNSSENDIELICYNSPAASYYFIKVYQLPYAGNTYDLWWGSNCTEQITLNSPPDGYRFEDCSPEIFLRWYESPRVNRYEIQIDDNSDFSSLCADLAFTAPHEYAEACYECGNLNAGTYYWRVRARTISPCNLFGDWSETRSFRVGCPSIEIDPVTLVPTDSTYITGYVNFDWAAVLYAAGYAFQMDTTSSDFVNILYDKIVPESHHSMILPSAREIHWRVRALGQGECSVGPWTSALISAQNAPIVSTDPATSVTSTTATLNGTINPNGLTTDCYFEYGATISYGSQTSSQNIGSGTSDVSISANLSGLTPDMTYHYRLVAVNSWGTTFGIDRAFESQLANSDVSQPPISYYLFPVYPNPFNPVSTILYELPRASEVSLIVYDILGREVARLVDGHTEPGYHQVKWNGRDKNGTELPSGIYIARLVTPEYTKSIKMVLLK